MPIAKIHVHEGRYDEARLGNVSKAVQDALISILKIPSDDFFQVIHELPRNRSEWLVGLTPHLRYNFATGTRWIPFLDGGAGVTATGIGPPDLSGIFEFNLQVGAGVQWFLRENVALSLEARHVHWSCAGISKPNLGLNGVTGMLGLTFFF